jgi:hypothetical protein
MDWVPDIGFTHSRDTKCVMQIDIYWHTKPILSQVSEEQGMQQKVILNTLNMQQKDTMDKLDYLDKKYEALVKLLWDMEAIGQAHN